MRFSLRSMVAAGVGLVVLGAVVLQAAGRTGLLHAGPTQELSGDLNGDGQLDVSDALHLLGFLFSGGPAPVPCGEPDVSDAATSTIIVVRHAEKSSGLDPGLTEVGQERAIRLAQVLGDSTYDLLLASELVRTAQTLTPLAEAHAQEIETIQTTADVVTRLDALRPGSTAVVAHHSFTIRGILSGLGLSDEDLARVRISGNDDMWIVHRLAGETPTLTVLRYGIDLNEPPPTLEEEGDA